MNFLIELEVITESGAAFRRERLVPAPTKDEAYDKFLSNEVIRKTLSRCERFSVSLREVEGL
jgi:hypothetical protein